ncbi:MAG: dihydrolipoamide acetyltransferase family protein [Thermodesulfobacteriota bacterium]|nr:dihydrolipoamide acetyltransferase family protein [Thermodesulfobacteriota bacterium]
MAVEVKLSSLGVSITEGTIVRWLKKEGEPVEKGEILAEVETEKVNFEIVAPEAGVLLKILYGEKTIAKVDSTVALIGSLGEDISAYLEKAVEEEKRGAEPRAVAARKREAAVAGEVKAFPAAKMLAKQHGIDIRMVPGTGPERQITKEDVENYIQERRTRREDRILELEEVIPFVGIRKTIADAMSHSVHTAAHVTTIAEVDMTELVKSRAEIAPKWKEEGISLTYVPFVIKAAINGIEKFPVINSELDKEGLVIKKYINFGVVVAIQEGLITPVIRRVETKSLKEIAKELDEISIRARDRKLSLQDLRGGTITLSNPGVFGAVIATPIIYQPQNAILWMGRIAKTPVVREDAIVIRSMMYLCLSYDHRAINGSIGAQFLQHVRRSLEDPEKLLDG